jgi:uncharacterized phiE125 gp8 family phage protein
MMDYRKAIKRLTEPTQNQEPILAADLALHAKIRSSAVTAETTLLNIYISAARRLVESQSRKILFPSDFKLTLDSFNCDEIDLYYSPINSVTKVDYYDTNNVLQTVDPTTYNSDVVGMPGIVELAYGRAWPIAAFNRPNSVAVYYNAGYSAVPPTLKLAVLMLATDFYERRQDTTELSLAMIPNGVTRLINAEHERVYR